MAKFVVLSVFDVALKAYGRPFVAPTVAAGQRAVADEVNTPNTELNKHHGDYRLFKLGEFDDETGLLSCGPSPELIVNCSGLYIPY